MPVNLSVKNVPDELAALLRERAKRHQRSMQRELLVILEEALRPRPVTIESLAKALQAELGSSRPVVDYGWLPHDHQIGSSGQSTSS